MKTIFSVLLISLLFSFNAMSKLNIVVPGYNYCGLGNRGMDQVPVNELDSVCREHDICERANKSRTGKYTSCACDRTFITSAFSVYGDSSLDMTQRNLARRFAKIIETRMNSVNCNALP